MPIDESIFRQLHPFPPFWVLVIIFSALIWPILWLIVKRIKHLMEKQDKQDENEDEE